MNKASFPPDHFPSACYGPERGYKNRKTSITKMDPGIALFVSFFLLLFFLVCVCVCVGEGGGCISSI